ncbi:MAG: alpha-galactosidase, partial [Oscillospiraceae bacterium]|nr:alpha-galactosidase [Oscillospiraceae bacterium]
MITTSPMGWNSWDCYGAAVDEKTVRANAEYCAKNLLASGYEYIVVDIQWYEPTAKNHEYHPFTELVTDGYSRLMPAVNRFPSAEGGKGFAPLAEYVHSLGLKFGIHIMRGIPRQAVHADSPIQGTDRTARQIAKTDGICCWNT